MRSPAVGPARSHLPVTCIVTCCNNRQTVRGAITSVLRQTRPVAEILVSDDGSSDGSQLVLEQIASNNPSVRLILRRTNLGIGTNRDLATRAASQPFVTHLDGDDLMTPRKLASEWRALQGRENVVAYSYFARIVPRRPWRTAILDPRPSVENAGQVLENLLARRYPIPRDMLMSKRLYNSAGGFKHGTNLYEDWQFKMALADQAKSWAFSDGLGTLYFQRMAGLSSASRRLHLEAVCSVILGHRELLTRHLTSQQIASAVSQVVRNDLHLLSPERQMMLQRLCGDLVPTSGRDSLDMWFRTQTRLRLIRFAADLATAHRAKVD